MPLLRNFEEFYPDEFSNKSKNKFAPKIKARPRPGSSSTPTPSQESNSSVAATLAPISAPPEQSSKEVLQSQSRLPIESKNSITPSASQLEPLKQLSTPPATQRELSVSELDEVPASPRPSGVYPVLRTSHSAVPQLQASQNGGVPILQVSNQADAAISRSSSYGIPTIQTSRSAIPQIKTSDSSATIIPTPSSTPVRDLEQDRDIVEQAENGKVIAQGSVYSDVEMGEREEGAGEEAGLTADAQINAAGKPARKPRAKKAANGEESSKRKKPASKSGQGSGKKRRKNQNKLNEENAGEPTDAEGVEENVAEDATPAQENPKKKRAPRKSTATGARRGRQRAQTPEDGESREISPSTTKMKDLCKDMKIGKKSKRGIELQHMDWTQVVREQMAAKEDMDRRKVAGEAVGETTEQRLERLANHSNRRNMGAPQVRLVDGQIIIDEESLQIDRHERDALDEDAFELVEENHNTRLVNSGTWGKREKVEKWDADATERFYTSLSMFGTDFELISRMYPGRSRRQLKNKYNLEERKHPERITAALRNRIPVDLKEYSEIASTEFPDPQDFADELQQLREAHEAEEQEAQGYAAQMERERQDAANAAMRENENETLAAEQAKKKKKKGKGKAAVNHGEEEIMTIEEYEAQRLRQAEEVDDW
ncbi:hypothetical protein RUND412_000030 [Rhizina undulata]